MEDDEESSLLLLTSLMDDVEEEDVGVGVKLESPGVDNFDDDDVTETTVNRLP